MANKFKLPELNMSTLQRLMQPQAASDLNDFLEKLPQNAGQVILIAAGIAWASAAAIGLYTSVQLRGLTELRAELKETQALKPLVPRIKDVPVNQRELDAFAADLSRIYSALNIKQQGASIQITAKSTALFGVFREAIGHVQNGGSGWRVSVDRLCVGRECDKNNLGVLLKINKVSVDKP